MPPRAAVARSDVGWRADAALERRGYRGLGARVETPGLSRRVRRRGTVQAHGREPRRIRTSRLREPPRDLLDLLVGGRPQGALLDELAVLPEWRDRRDPRGVRCDQERLGGGVGRPPGLVAGR